MIMLALVAIFRGVDGFQVFLKASLNRFIQKTIVKTRIPGKVICQLRNVQRSAIILQIWSPLYLTLCTSIPCHLGVKSTVLLQLCMNRLCFD